MMADRAGGNRLRGGIGPGATDGYEGVVVAAVDDRASWTVTTTTRSSGSMNTYTMTSHRQGPRTKRNPSQRPLNAGPISGKRSSARSGRDPGSSVGRETMCADRAVEVFDDRHREPRYSACRNPTGRRRQARLRPGGLTSAAQRHRASDPSAQRPACRRHRRSPFGTEARPFRNRTSAADAILRARLSRPEHGRVAGGVGRRRDRRREWATLDSEMAGSSFRSGPDALIPSSSLTQALLDRHMRPIVAEALTTAAAWPFWEPVRSARARWPANSPVTSSPPASSPRRRGGSTRRHQ